MLSQFKFKGEASSAYGLMISSPPKQSAPARVVERVAVQGRSGTLEIDQNRYEDIQVSYSVGFKTGFKKTPYVANAIKAWLLSGSGFYELADTYDTDYFRKASYSGPLEIEDIFRRGGKMTITFTCHPFKYSYLGQQTFSVDTQTDIVNPERFESLPRFTVYGNGAGNLYIGNQRIAFSSIDGFVVLDSETEQALKGDSNKNPTVTLSDYPRLQPGSTSVQWDGGIERLEIIPRWCTL